jgi:hypothetical protein
MKNEEKPSEAKSGEPQKLSAFHGKKKKEDVLLTLSESEREVFKKLVKEVGDWSQWFYGTKFISYVILAELVRSGWRKHD